MRNLYRFGAPLVLLLAASAAEAAISVTVNGEFVPFYGTQPQMVNGRILVPLRGVMEKLGAEVSWRPETRTAVATDADTSVVLRIGDREAAVNGQPVYLDVPGLILAGSTMVPLRFLSEALGAEVKWHGAQQLVEITTTPVAPPPPVITPTILSFDHNAESWVAASSQIRLKLVGTSGGTASVRVPGLAERQMLTETQPGVYEGTLIVPRDTENATRRLPVIGELTFAGQSQMIQAGHTLQIDTNAPIFGVATPPTGARVATHRPDVSLTFDDGAGSGVSPGAVTLTVNGQDVTPAARVTADHLIYAPTADLPVGANIVRVGLADHAGNLAERTWSFDVVPLQNVVYSFTHDATTALEPGDQLTVTMRAETGGQARYRIGDGELRWLTEIETGLYRGYYTVRKGDVFDATPVHGEFTTRAGQPYAFDAPTNLSTTSLKAALAVPRITIPASNELIGSTLTVKGMADPGAEVLVRITYRSKLLGLLTVTGIAAEETVRTDDYGYWMTKAIDLDAAAGGRAESCTITAQALAADGRRSDLASIDVRR